MTTEIVIGVLGLILSTFIFWAGVRHEKRRHSQDDTEARINKVVDEYQSLYQPRKDSGVPALIQVGVLLLTSDAEIREACRRLELRNNTSPLSPWAEELSSVDLRKFFQVIQNHKLNPRHPDCLKLAKEKMK